MVNYKIIVVKFLGCTNKYPASRIKLIDYKLKESKIIKYENRDNYFWETAERYLIERGFVIVGRVGTLKTDDEMGILTSTFDVSVK